MEATWNPCASLTPAADTRVSRRHSVLAWRQPNSPSRCDGALSGTAPAQESSTAAPRRDGRDPIREARPARCLCSCPRCWQHSHCVAHPTRGGPSQRQSHFRCRPDPVQPHPVWLRRRSRVAVKAHPRATRAMVSASRGCRHEAGDGRTLAGPCARDRHFRGLHRCGERVRDANDRMHGDGRIFAGYMRPRLCGPPRFRDLSAASSLRRTEGS